MALTSREVLTFIGVVTVSVLWIIISFALYPMFGPAAFYGVLVGCITLLLGVFSVFM